MVPYDSRLDVVSHMVSIDMVWKLCLSYVSKTPKHCIQFIERKYEWNDNQFIDDCIGNTIRVDFPYKHVLCLAYCLLNDIQFITQLIITTNTRQLFTDYIANSSERMQSSDSSQPTRPPRLTRASSKESSVSSSYQVIARCLNDYEMTISWRDGH